MRAYEGIVNVILLDPSGGRGESFTNTDTFRSHIERFMHAHPTIEVGVADSIGPGSFAHIRDLMRDFP